ncbi:hypothetical protein GCM10022247_03500 [Allokutzneria multivorans]|uniref:AB hydrolase-1 domain-containing protein n=1 Tax=Allokutzneria multivorans TaxID=1142134 RepID=A0ABP7QVV8_9PSEU
MLQHFPVDGGSLAMDVRTADTAPVLALHGVTSHRRLWNWVTAREPGLSLIAPDLRGRGDSSDITGPFSLRQHTEDLLRVLDALQINEIIVCGMSMGGFLGVDLAVRHPDRVSELVLLDGGFPMAGHDKLTPEMVPLAFAPEFALMERTWPDLDEYVAVHAAANSLLSADDPLLRDYFAHSLADGRVRLNRDAVLSDAKDVFFGEPQWRELTVPTRLVYAEWSVGKDSSPAYTPDAVAGFEAELDCLAPSVRVSTVDHGTLMMSQTGAAAVAEVLVEVCGKRD